MSAKFLVSSAVLAMLIIMALCADKKGGASNRKGKASARKPSPSKPSGKPEESKKRHGTTTGGRRSSSTRGSSTGSGGSDGKTKSDPAKEAVLNQLERSGKLRYEMKGDKAFNEALKAYQAARKKPSPDYEVKNEVWDNGLYRGLQYRNFVQFLCASVKKHNLCEDARYAYDVDTLQFAETIVSKKDNAEDVDKFYFTLTINANSKTDGFEKSHFNAYLNEIGQMPALETYYAYAIQAVQPYGGELEFVKPFIQFAKSRVQIRYHDAIKIMLDNGNDSILRLWWEQKGLEGLKNLHGQLEDYLKTAPNQNQPETGDLARHEALKAINILDIIAVNIRDPKLLGEFNLKRHSSRQQIEALYIARKSSDDPNMWDGYVQQLYEFVKKRKIAFVKTSSFYQFHYSVSDWHDDTTKLPVEIYMSKLHRIATTNELCKKFIHTLQYRAQFEEVLAEAAAFAADEINKANGRIDVAAISNWHPQARMFYTLHQYLLHEQETGAVKGIIHDFRNFVYTTLEPEDDDKKKVLKEYIDGSVKTLASEFSTELNNQLKLHLAAKPDHESTVDFAKICDQLTEIYPIYKSSDEYTAELAALRGKYIKEDDDRQNTEPPPFQVNLDSFVSKDGVWSQKDVDREKENFPIIYSFLVWLASKSSGSQKKNLEKLANQQLPFVTNQFLANAFNDHTTVAERNAIINYDYALNTTYQLLYDSFSVRYTQFNETVFVNVFNVFAQRKLPACYNVRSFKTSSDLKLPSRSTTKRRLSSRSGSGKSSKRSARSRS